VFEFFIRAQQAVIVANQFTNDLKACLEDNIDLSEKNIYKRQLELEKLLETLCREADQYAETNPSNLLTDADEAAVGRAVRAISRIRLNRQDSSDCLKQEREDANLTYPAAVQGSKSTATQHLETSRSSHKSTATSPLTKSQYHRNGEEVCGSFQATAAPPILSGKQFQTPHLRQACLGYLSSIAVPTTR
jgi:hypothetical protein